MRFSTTTSALAFVAAASAQTFTDCDPTKKTCPKDVGLPASTFTSDFKQGDTANASWSAAAYSTISYGNTGAEFSISNGKQAPTIETDFNIFFGRIDIKMKAAKGQGIVSSIVLESDDLDEIDWEFIGSDNAQVQSNFYGKGNTTTYDRVVYHPVTTPTDTFHTYSIDWTAERLQFLIDGALVRTVQYSEPKTVNGKNYPQTPAKLKLGNWCGGCDGAAEGTVQWAGGKASFANAPYVMYVDSVNVKNYNPADAYEWTDRSGSWESIKAINDGSASQPTGGSNGGSSATGTGTMAPTASHSVGNIHISNTPSSTVTGTGHASARPGPTGSYGNGSGSEGGSGTASGSGSESGSGSGSESGSDSGSDSGSGSGSNSDSGSGSGSGSGSNSGDHGGMAGGETCTDSAVAGPTGGYGSGSGSSGSGSGSVFVSPGSTFTSVAVVNPTGQVPYPSGTGVAPGGYGGSNGTVTNPASPSGPAQQTGNAASTLTVASGSLFGVVFGLLFL